MAREDSLKSWGSKMQLAKGIERGEILLGCDDTQLRCRDILQRCRSIPIRYRGMQLTRYGSALRRNDILSEAKQIEL